MKNWMIAQNLTLQFTLLNNTACLCKSRYALKNKCCSYTMLSKTDNGDNGNFNS